MRGFVERIGDSVALVSSDGSAHDPDLLMVEALDAMVLAAGADVASSEISIAVPAYWKPGTVQALRNAIANAFGLRPKRHGAAPGLGRDRGADRGERGAVPRGNGRRRGARFRRLPARRPHW